MESRHLEKERAEINPAENSQNDHAADREAGCPDDPQADDPHGASLSDKLSLELDAGEADEKGQKEFHPAENL